MTPFIPANELSNLLKGSFQHTSALVADALKESKAFSGKPVHLVACFDKHAVVMSEAGDAFKVGYEISESGSVHFIGQEVLPVTVVTEKTARRYAQAEAKLIVDLFFKGLTEQAEERMAALLPIVDAATANSDEELLQGFAESLEADRVWKKLVKDRAESVKQYLGESAPQTTAVAPKFKKLYDGSTSAEELPKFKSLVRDDTAHLLGRISAVRKQAEEAVHAAALVKEAAEAEGIAEGLAVLESYAADLLSDVRQIEAFVQEAIEEFGRVDLLAQVFDSLAEEVASFEVAGAFASKMASRLAESGR